MPIKDPTHRRIASLQLCSIINTYAKVRYKRAKKEAKRRGLSFNISMASYALLTNKPCHYCGTTTPEAGGWMDRIDNSKGYSVSNVLPCCAMCNRMRGTLPVELFLWAVRRIARKN